MDDGRNDAILAHQLEDLQDEGGRSNTGSDRNANSSVHLPTMPDLSDRHLSDIRTHRIGPAPPEKKFLGLEN
jgi:hypothetical protein